MSASMYWRPSPPKPDGEYVADRVRQAITERLWGQSYSDSMEPQTLDGDVLPYLNGLVDAGLGEAQELIDAIRKHGSIEIWISR